MEPNAQEACNTILQQTRSSNLNFTFQETPYSVFLTIRKSFSKRTLNHFPRIEPGNSVPLENLTTKSSSELFQADILALKLKNEHLEKANDDLKNDYNEEVLASEALKAALDDSKERLNCLGANFEQIQSELHKSKCHLKQLEEKHAKTCVELKGLKKNDLEKETKHLNVAIKALKKESKTIQSERDKVVKEKDDTIQELLQFKILKTSEEKALKNRTKKLDKRLKAVEEREIKLRESNEGNDTSSEMKVRDVNENETNVTFEESSTVASQSIPRIPTKNSFEVLGKQNQEVLEVDENDSDAFENKLRKKIRDSTKKKVQAKLSEDLLSDAEAVLLEEQLIEEFDEVIKEEMERFKSNLEPGKVMEEEETEYEEPCHQFYWGPEGEIIFIDD